MIKIDAWVQGIEGNRAGDRSEKVRITASYEAASILSSITFNVPIAQAHDYFVGQKIRIAIYSNFTEMEVNDALQTNR